MLILLINDMLQKEFCNKIELNIYREELISILAITMRDLDSNLKQIRRFQV